MTTFSKRYDLTAEQRSLLRDLIVYMMSQGDAHVAQGENFPYLRWQSYSREVLAMLNEGKEVRGYGLYYIYNARCG